MANWTRLSAPAQGALNPKWITRIALLLGSVLAGGMLLMNSCFSAAPATDPAAGGPAAVGPIADNRAAGQLDRAIEDVETRTRLEADAAARQLAAQQPTQLSAGERTPAFDPTTGEVLPDAPVVVPLTDDEAQLREVLRLEAIERRARSLRAGAVVLSYRPPGLNPPPGDAQAAAQANAAPALTTPAAAPPDAPPLPEPVSLMDTIQALQALDAQQTALTAAAGAPGLQLQTPGLSPLGAPTGATTGRGDPQNPVVVQFPNTPAGWERIYEGSFLEATLVNQLNGDFPGPVVAAVSAPVYSADRQRIVIPRGARVIGSASAVGGPDQERLAVGFHRLIFPDGRWLSLAFAGLNQAGEGALKDQVNRHYVSMFASVGAVGVLSGLTLIGSDPFAGGRQGFQAGVGQGLAQSATQILSRFLNRLPTITIRAGHRLRIWITSDVLVPRPV